MFASTLFTWIKMYSLFLFSLNLSIYFCGIQCAASRDLSVCSEGSWRKNNGDADKGQGLQKEEENHKNEEISSFVLNREIKGGGNDKEKGLKMMKVRWKKTELL